MRCIRGAVLWPVGPRRVVFLRDGTIEAAATSPRAARPGDPDRESGLVLPGFGDWHFHWVQRGIAGVGGRPLLEWLRETAWPAERRYSDPAECGRGAADAVAALASAGTAAGAAYGSPHAASADAFLAAAPRGFLCGPAVMTEGEPPDLVRPVARWLDDLGALVRAHGDRVAVAPRFALSVGAPGLAALGRFARDHGLAVTTHLSEHPDEVAAVARRFPRARDYLDVYERAGLVGPRTLLGHGIHLGDGELSRIAAAGAAIVHCPTSNRALGSGRMPVERLRSAGVRWVLGSDVGAGPHLDLLDVIVGALDAHAGRAPVTAAELFHRATLGAGAVLAGRTEGETAAEDRPGALVVATDAPLPDDDGDAAGERALEALLAVHRGGRRFRVRRIAEWG